MDVQTYKGLSHGRKLGCMEHFNCAGTAFYRALTGAGDHFCLADVSSLWSRDEATEASHAMFPILTIL